MSADHGHGHEAKHDAHGERHEDHGAHNVKEKVKATSSAVRKNIFSLFMNKIFGFVKKIFKKNKAAPTSH